MSTIYDITPGRRRNFLILSDLHSDKCHIGALDLCLKVFDLTPPTKRSIVLLGDILGNDWAHKKNESFQEKLKRGDWDSLISDWQQEIIWFEGLIDKLKNYVDVKDIYFASGNHDLYPENFMDKVPHALKHNFNVFESLKLKELGIQHCTYNEFFKIGQLYLTHGLYASSNPLKKHYDVIQEDFIIGHLHWSDVMSFSSMSGTKYGRINPCLTRADEHKYMNKRPDKWSLGCTMVNYLDGHSYCHTILVENEKIVLADGMIVD